MAYTYEKQLWKDYPDTTTPVTAERLNHMEDGISEAAKSGGGDTIPVGSEFDYDGTTVPEGYQQVDNPNGKILWTNPNPTAGFPAQTITLNSDDYDILEIYFDIYIDTNLINCNKFVKGTGTRLSYVTTSTNNIYRNITRVNDKKYSVENATSNSGVLNDNLIPQYIIGYKTGLFN